LHRKNFRLTLVDPTIDPSLCTPVWNYERMWPTVSLSERLTLCWWLMELKCSISSDYIFRYWFSTFTVFATCSYGRCP
jgi:hypothetical protein